jgi:phosphatidate cytidylyltransferase
MSAKLSNFYQRSLSALVLFPMAMYIVYTGGLLLFSLIFVAILIAVYEWNNICGRWSFSIDGMALSSFVMLTFTTIFMEKMLLATIFFILGIYVSYFLAKLRSKTELKALVPSYINRPLWFALGMLYMGLGFGSIAYVHNLDYYHITLVWVFLATVFNDVFAYIFGSLIGGKKIAPKISPGKSYSGLIFACLSTGLLSYGFAIYLKSNNELKVVLIGLFLGVVAHFGDMLESAIKRYLNIKDTSNLIPGHGGILDRIDALVMVSFFVSIISFIMGKSPLF